jgi:hypothetical protein
MGDRSTRRPLDDDRTSNAHIGGFCGHAGSTWRNQTVAGNAVDMQQFELNTSSRFASTSARADRSKGGEPT